MIVADFRMYCFYAGKITYSLFSRRVECVTIVLQTEISG